MYLHQDLEDKRNYESLSCDEIDMDDEIGPVVRHCERCQTLTKCEHIPMMGYSEWLCWKCAASAYRNGEAV